MVFFFFCSATELYNNHYLMSEHLYPPKRNSVPISRHSIFPQLLLPAPILDSPWQPLIYFRLYKFVYSIVIFNTFSGVASSYLPPSSLISVSPLGSNSTPYMALS